MLEKNIGQIAVLTVHHWLSAGLIENSKNKSYHTPVQQEHNSTNQLVSSAQHRTTNLHTYRKSTRTILQMRSTSIAQKQEARESLACQNLYRKIGSGRTDQSALVEISEQLARKTQNIQRANSRTSVNLSRLPIARAALI